MEKKTTEIKIFLGCDLFSAILQFGWDYWANMNSLTLPDCIYYYEARDLLSVITLYILDIHNFIDENINSCNLTNSHILFTIFQTKKLI